MHYDYPPGERLWERGQHFIENSTGFRIFHRIECGTEYLWMRGCVLECRIGGPATMHMRSRILAAVRRAES